MPDWSLLHPYSALAEGDVDLLYEPRPAEVELDLAARVRAGFGGGRIALNGPAGVGKSTELARAARELRATHAVGTIVLDGGERTEPEQVLWDVLGALVPDVDGRRDAFVEASTATSMAEALEIHGSARRLDHVLDTISYELRGHAARSGRPHVVLVDGIERITDTPRAQSTLLWLATLAERADLSVVVVLSPAVVSGAQGALVAERYKVLNLRPALALEGGASEAARLRFLRGIALRRLPPGLATPSELSVVWARAAEWSGGLPRLFLQLLSDAAAYAALRGDDWPRSTDLDEAVADHRDSLALMLEDGDLMALDAAARGKVDIGSATRARLLATGLLLELPRGSRATYQVHPLAQGLVAMARSA